MAQNYSPELGQMLFGQPHQAFEAPPALEHALSLIGENIVAAAAARKEQQDNPFQNTGATFKNDVFEVQAYSWNEEEEQPFNFAWRDLRVSWYKYVGRGMSANMEVDARLVNEMLIDCLNSIWSPAAHVELARRIG